MNAAAPRAPTAAQTASPAERKALALQRLDASRTQIILRLLPDEPARSSPKSTGPNAGPDFQGFTHTLLKRIERNGLANGAWRMARAWGRRWWTRQPWHTTAELLASTVAHEAKPIIRRHPMAALAAGAAVGAGLMALSPWAGRALRQKARPWSHQFGGMLWRQLAQAPVQIALATAVTAWLTELSRASHARAAETETPPVSAAKTQDTAPATPPPFTPSVP
jgi:hypothetical protein